VVYQDWRIQSSGFPDHAASFAAGSARASLGPDHDPLLRAGHRAPAGCCELDLRAATGNGFANRSAGCGSIAGKFRQYSGSDASGKKQAPGALTLT
jgi:hypothetical protein